MNKTVKAVQFVETTVDMEELERLQPSKPLCGLLLNFGFWLGSLAQLDREHSVLKRTIRIAEEHDYKVELGYALLNLSAHIVGSGILNWPSLT